MGEVLGFITLRQQAAFAPSPAWQAAAAQLMTAAAALPKGGYHAATSEGKS